MQAYLQSSDKCLQSCRDVYNMSTSVSIVIIPKYREKAYNLEHVKAPRIASFNNLQIRKIPIDRQKTIMS